MANGSRANHHVGSVTLLTVVIVVAVFYFAREVFIPLALALLLAFLLAPLVIFLRHWHLGRVPSALIVVVLFFAAIGFLGTIMASQLSDLGRKLPEYQQNVHQKLERLRASGGGYLNRVSRLVHNLNEELTPNPGPGPEHRPGEVKPVPVEVRSSPFSPVQIVQKILGSVVSAGVTAGIVIVFVIFMLIEREDLRDRLIRLGGSQRVGLTTKVLADAASRVSRYLLAQLVVNVVYGALAGVGLWLLKVPNPLLWGITAALFRYIPYLGIWIAAVMPALVAFAVEPQWIRGPLVFALYFGIDLFMYNFVEPLLYGSSTGVSPLAILLGAVFWTWLWGPVGLLLATPLTVCVVVIGRHVPQVEFLSILLSDEPVLAPETRFYQRMLARDLEEATQVAEEFLKGKSLEELYDRLIVPALSLAEEDRHRGKLDERHQQFIFETTRMLVDDLAERADDLVGGSGGTKVLRAAPPKADGEPAAQEAEVVCIPARDEADEIAAQMLVQLLNKQGIGAKALRVASMASECLEEVQRHRPRIACISAVPPFGYTHARYLCRRLRDQFADMKVVAGILTERDAAELKQRQPPILADQLASSLKQEVREVLALAPEVGVPSTVTEEFKEPADKPINPKLP